MLIKAFNYSLIESQYSIKKTVMFSFASDKTCCPDLIKTIFRDNFREITESLFSWRYIAVYFYHQPRYQVPTEMLNLVEKLGTKHALQISPQILDEKQKCYRLIFLTDYL